MDTETKEALKELKRFEKTQESYSWKETFNEDQFMNDPTTPSQEEVMKAVSVILKTTLGNMSVQQADQVVKACTEILEATADVY
jgi:hypothetical protein